MLSDAYSNKSWETIVAQGLFTLREINQTEREITRGSSLCSSLYALLCSLYALLCSLWPGLNGALSSKSSQSHRDDLPYQEGTSNFNAHLASNVLLAVELYKNIRIRSLLWRIDSYVCPLT